MWRRLQTALEFIRRNGDADGLDDELKYAAELDDSEKHDRYGFARIMIWAIPMLGFLGTVLGISEALGGLEIVHQRLVSLGPQGPAALSS